MFVAALAGLLVAGHLLVTGAVLIGRRLGLTPAVIGLTIVAAGTSAPELAVFARAVSVNDTELAVGSVVGSNIANILLVLGLVATLGTVRLASRLVRIDVPVMIGASLLLMVFALDGLVRPLEAVVLVAGVVLFIAYTVRSSRADVPLPSAGSAGTGGDVAPETAQVSIGPAPRLVRGLGLVVVGAIGLVVAANHVVSGAEQIAANLGVPELIIGLTVVALGTSAPEIVTSVLAAFRGERELAVGNAIGSNIFNILLVIGLSGLFARPGIGISVDVIAVDLPIMVAVAVACLPLLFWDHKLDRWEGLVFLAYYGAYTVFLVLTATDHGATETYVAAMLWFVLPITVLTAATIVIRGRNRPSDLDKGRTSGAGSGRQTATRRPRSSRATSVTVHNRSSGPKEVPTWAPSHHNPLLLMRPSRNNSNRSAPKSGATGTASRVSTPARGNRP